MSFLKFDTRFAILFSILSIAEYLIGGFVKALPWSVFYKFSSYYRSTLFSILLNHPPKQLHRTNLYSG